MLLEEVIKLAQTEWAASILFPLKRDDSTCVCVDYEILNAVTKRHVYPLPSMNDCIDSLGEAALFSMLLENSACWKIELENDD